jgi:hypothetical protein
MSAQVSTILLVAGALLVMPGAAGPRARLCRVGKSSSPPAEPVPARWRTRRADIGDQSWELGGAWELLAACLRAGMPIPTAVRAVAEGSAPRPDRRCGAPRSCSPWAPTRRRPGNPVWSAPAPLRLARAARRSGRSGSALAESLTRLAAELRADAGQRAEARAQRAGVLITAPLGLCFLPAFLAIGVVPVLIGLATGLLPQW